MNMILLFLQLFLFFFLLFVVYFLFHDFAINLKERKFRNAAQVILCNLQLFTVK